MGTTRRDSLLFPGRAPACNGAADAAVGGCGDELERQTECEGQGEQDIFLDHPLRYNIRYLHMHEDIEEGV